jgi:serine/threonine-protein kinase
VSKIGRYEIEREIGRGAMGVVQLARDPRLRRQVAVKTYALSDGLTDEQKREFHERFLREAQAAAGLSHRGIVTIYDADEDPGSGTPFIAMEYVSGKTLAELVAEQGRLDPERVFAMADVLADALGVAHDAGIVHRDLKPANVLVRESDGAVKIADFGVARLPTSKLTQTGTTVGSPGYMSPEQIQGQPVDARSDLFSLAVLLYESLCGESPFAGDDLPALAYSIVHETPLPVTRRVEGLPPGLDAFFDRALAKDPNARFATAAHFRRGLSESLRATPPAQATIVDGDLPRPRPAAPEKPEPREPAPGPLPKDDARSPRLGASVAAAGTLLALVLIAWWYWGGGGEAHLKIVGESSVKSGNLTVFVDGKRVYSRELAVRGNKAMGLIKKVVGKGQESFETWVEVSPGKHEIQASVVTRDNPSGYHDSVTVDLEEGETQKLKVVAGKAFNTPLDLRKN